MSEEPFKTINRLLDKIDMLENVISSYRGIINNLERENKKLRKKLEEQENAE